MKGEYPHAYVDEEAAREKMDIRPGDMEQLKEPLDFIGVNLYSRTIVADSGDSRNIGVRQMPGAGTGPRTDFNWEVWPAAIYQLLMRFWKDYGPTPMYVTENGCSYADQAGRGRARTRRAAHRFLSRVYRTGRARARGGRRCPRVLRVVAARQLRVGRRVQASGSGSSTVDFETQKRHDQGQRVLVPGPDRKG